MDPVIDISHWQDEVDFAAVKKSGVIGVIHKLTQGTDYLDPTFRERYDKYAARRISAEAIGLLWGAYHFLEPGDIADQAEWFCDSAADAGPLLLAADHEDAGVSINDLKTFLRHVEERTGQKPVVYSGHVIREQLGDTRDDELALHRLWIAHYTDAASPDWPEKTWTTWWLWQHTDTGSTPGIPGDCDQNRFAGETSQLIDEWLGYD